MNKQASKFGRNRKTSPRGARVLLLALLAFTAAATPEQSRELAPGLDSLRPGLSAYGDLWQLAFRHDGLHAGQSASHDERDLNIDLGHFHGWYRGERVLARVTGPGVVYRVWSADPSGRISFWVDDESAPLIVCDFRSYLTGLCASAPEFFVGRFANYTPLPFSRSLLVTAKGFHLAGAYYQISYMIFDRNPGIPAATATPGAADPEAFAAAVRFFKTNGREPARDPGGLPLEASAVLEIPPGEPRTLSIPGPGLITELRVVDQDNALDPLADLLLRVNWDGELEPAVDSPVDAFFGNRFDARSKSRKGAYETIAVSATAAGYSCRWPMPFSELMRLALVNRGAATRRVRVEASYRSLAALPANTMRFHALYHEQNYPDSLSRENVYGLFFRVDQSANYVALDRSGRGYYVGGFLYVASLGTLWWGEGDEMIWVDDAPLAVIRGTGTEDEFNWSYGFQENRSPVSGALLVGRYRRGTPETTVGDNALYRFRLGDFIPFEKAIKVTYERLGSSWIKRYPGSLVNISPFRGDDYRSVAFWYELP